MSRAYDRRFHAEEFGPLDRDIREILEHAATSEIPLCVDSKISGYVYERYDLGSTVEKQLDIFLANKSKIRLFFANALLRQCLAFPSEELMAQALAMLRAPKSEGMSKGMAVDIMAVDITVDSASCLRIIKKSEEEYYVILPFSNGSHAREATVSEERPIVATTRPGTVDGKAFPAAGGHVFLVKADLIRTILGWATTSITIQQKLAEAASFAGTLKSTKRRLESELGVHDYRPIYEGTAGIAWGGSLGSMFSSFFEPKPKHNLDKVIRLLKNYLNPLKSMGHTHTSEVELLITNLESIRKVYEENCAKEDSNNAMMDIVIFDKLQDIFKKCDDNNEEGSLMRRLIFAMEKILPGITEASGVTRAASTGSAVAAAGGAAAGAGAGAGAGATAAVDPLHNPFAM